jgi:hypothetical protein
MIGSRNVTASCRLSRTVSGRLSRDMTRRFTVLIGRDVTARMGTLSGTNRGTMPLHDRVDWFRKKHHLVQCRSQLISVLGFEPELLPTAQAVGLQLDHQVRTGPFVSLHPWYAQGASTAALRISVQGRRSRRGRRLVVVVLPANGTDAATGANAEQGVVKSSTAPCFLPVF